MASSFGNKIKIHIYGQSHSAAIGAVIEGLPSGHKIDFETLDTFMKRRESKKSPLTTERREADEIEIVSGLYNNTTCGAPLCLQIKNKDVKSSDYIDNSHIPRPSHVDYSMRMKYGPYADFRGGGHLSGRITAPLCAAGGILIQILQKYGIEIGAHIYSIGEIRDDSFDMTDIKTVLLDELKGKVYPVINSLVEERMLEIISKTAKEGDTIGGIAECAVTGIRAGYGEPIFDGIENHIAQAVFAVPAVRGIEFGSGFTGSGKFGSIENDPFYINNNKVMTKTNNHGGVLGGITTGMPVIFRVAVKPVPSIKIEQDSVDLDKNENVKLIITGRHDSCILLRAIPCFEAAAACAVADFVL